MVKKFVSTTEAMQQTGYSRDWFMARIKSKSFVKGKHYRNTSDGRRPTYEFNLEAIEKFYT
jgi:hypothetical protein